VFAIFIMAAMTKEKPLRAWVSHFDRTCRSNWLLVSVFMKSRHGEHQRPAEIQAYLKSKAWS
jgi:hypothetical protein